MVCSIKTYGRQDVITMIIKLSIPDQHNIGCDLLSTARLHRLVQLAPYINEFLQYKPLLCRIQGQNITGDDGIPFFKE